MKEDFSLSPNHLPAVNMPEGRKNQAIFFLHAFYPYFVLSVMLLLVKSPL